ncbi:hypothetical protein AB4037_29130 [Labrys sp. KB_33_2]|uniref:hypothetical protein n=1 Tax=Labrys sp. KB_33_2 TaxID=3237479 RepID=UPI003F91066D
MTHTDIIVAVAYLVPVTSLLLILLRMRHENARLCGDITARLREIDRLTADLRRVQALSQDGVAVDGFISTLSASLNGSEIRR